jgi:2,4-dienoyl-CoA reductase-like NADH-dependent reductase (Old Yellow Enzyme family)/thioredoxin reductase
MKTNMAEDKGFVSQQMIDYYAARAAGGCALVIAEAATVHTPTAPRDFLGLNSDEHLPGLKALTDAIHKEGGRASVQLWQGGIVPLLTDPEGTYGVWPVDFEAMDVEAASEKTILELIDAFGDAADRCVRAGFDSVEFHCGHNYSPHAFLSPAFNKRTDDWGGSFENCMRYPLEIIKSIRRNIPEGMPLFIRVSVIDDFLEDGLTLDMMIEFLQKAREAGVDVADCSRGNLFTPALDYEVPSINIERGFNVDNAARVKAETGLVTMAVGRINAPAQAEEILASGKADLLGMGRAQIADPNFMNKIKVGALDDIRRCCGCNQGCLDSITNPEVPNITCLQNPAVGREAEFSAKLVTTESPKTVLIAGGGMAGMEAAARLKVRGHTPILCEETLKLGGQLLLAGAAPRKDEMRLVAEDRARQIVDQGVDIRMNTTVDVALIEEIKPDAVVIAIGASPIALNIPVEEDANVVGAKEILEGKGGVSGQTVVIGGGLVGLEVAEYLAEREPAVSKITVVEMLSVIGKDLGSSRINGVMDNLQAHQVEKLVKTKCLEIKKDSVEAECKGESVSIPSDSVVIAIGSRSRDTSELIEFLETKGIPHYEVGDAVRARKALEAVREGAETANAV